LGTPVVSTSKGAEGLEITPEKDILIADTPDEFARQVIRLFKDKNLRASLAECGRRLVEEKYSWEFIAQRFEQTLVEVSRLRNMG
jgi:glycosyltransferase involved in cell wall biosynthesis